MLNANTEINDPGARLQQGLRHLLGQLFHLELRRQRQQQHPVQLQSEAGDMVDYYFFYGPSIDQVIATTGPRPARPRCFRSGLTASSSRRTTIGSQAELLQVKNGYRNNNIPVDCHRSRLGLLDPDVWGSHFMDAAAIPIRPRI